MDETVVDVEGVSQKVMYKTNLPKPLALEEKKYLLAVERGDMANVRRMLQKAHRHHHIDIDCVDSLGRGALTLAIDGENLEMVELLVIMGVKTKDGLLHAINAEFVEAVELLLEHEELIHNENEPYSWQTVDLSTASFTPDVTPLILAAHKNNYEILKILLDRGATIPMPHDIKCGCDDCIRESKEDSLRQALSRLNEYKALASPSLIALSSSDPLLTAFQLSWELRNLAFGEPECRSEYMELRKQCQQFAVDLLHQSRSSEELAIILNHDPDNPPEEGEHMKLARLELAITYKQKKFVAHPNIQQLLAALWYEGVPGFRRKTTMEKLIITIRTAVLFPLYCTLYMLAPNTSTGKLMRKPFMKFLIHASSYLFFLFILILVSQRAEDQLIEFFGTENMKAERFDKQRGNPPAYLEYLVLIYVIGFIYEETYEIYVEGIKSYLRNLWNFIDFTRNFLYCLVFLLRVAAYLQQKNETEQDPSTAYIPREKWNAFDPQLIAEGLFAAANIFSALKLVHLFSINPHLGPLQISLGRMVIDIVKFFFIYSLVLFAFACGLNQLLWYFSDLERKKCYVLPHGEPDWENQGDSCMKWRSFANVFEASQSLFWASFGMVDLGSFELTGIKTYTRFWGLLMFGSYSVINVIVLLNLLIAMMSNSYAMIDEHSDTEWKFARTKLWLSYFEEGNTLPPPFNIFPTLKTFLKTFKLRKKDKLKSISCKKQNREEKDRDYRYTSVMRALVWRYVSSVHKRMEEDAVTEDDINEVKGDISAFRYDILEVLNRNGMDISCVETKEKAVLGKKMKIWERRLMKDFKVAPIVIDEEVDQLMYESPPENEEPIARFRRVAKLAVLNSNMHKWGQIVTGACLASQIGHCSTKDSIKKQQNLLKAMEEAQRIVNRSPLPMSRSSTPFELPDTTGRSIMDILKGIDLSSQQKVANSALKLLSNMKSPLQPNVVVKTQPSFALSPPTPKKEKYDQKSETETNILTDIPDFITLESPKSPSIKSINDTFIIPEETFSEDVISIKTEDTTSYVKPETLPESKSITTSEVEITTELKEPSPKIEKIILTKTEDITNQVELETLPETKSTIIPETEDKIEPDSLAKIEKINLLKTEDTTSQVKPETLPESTPSPKAESPKKCDQDTSKEEAISSTPTMQSPSLSKETSSSEDTVKEVESAKSSVEPNICSEDSGTTVIEESQDKTKSAVLEKTTSIQEEEGSETVPSENKIEAVEVTSESTKETPEQEKNISGSKPETKLVPAVEDCKPIKKIEAIEITSESTKETPELEKNISGSKPETKLVPAVEKCKPTDTELVKDSQTEEKQVEPKKQEPVETKPMIEIPKPTPPTEPEQDKLEPEQDKLAPEQSKPTEDSKVVTEKKDVPLSTEKKTSPSHSGGSETGSIKTKSRKGQAPAIPEIKILDEEEKKDTVADKLPKEIKHEEKSPLSSRNITRIGDKKPRRQPKTGWL